MSDTVIAIVGGGISGLSAAYELNRRGVPFVLLEKSARVGGLVRTERIDGFTIDTGPDSLLIQKPAAIELCAELGLTNKLVSTLPPRTAYVVRKGTLRPLPSASVFGIPTSATPLLTGKLLSTSGKLRMSLDLIIPPRRHKSDESVANFFRRRFGKESVDYLAEPLLAGIHAGDVEALSMHALFPRLVDAEKTHGSVIRAFHKLLSKAGDNRARYGLFRSFADGLYALVEGIISVLPPTAVQCDTEVVGLSGTGPFVLNCSGRPPINARQVIFAVPAYRAADLLHPIDRKIGSLCSMISYTSTATVVLAYPRSVVRHPLLGTGFVVPKTEPNTMITAATWISSKWPQRAPDDHILLRGFVGGARSPGALKQSDQTLMAGVQRDFSRLLMIDGEPSLARIYRWQNANPQPNVGHLEHVAAIDYALASVPDLHIIGAAFRGVGIPDCVAAGRSAGANAEMRYSSR